MEIRPQTPATNVTLLKQVASGTSEDVIYRPKSSVTNKPFWGTSNKIHGDYPPKSPNIFSQEINMMKDVNDHIKGDQQDLKALYVKNKEKDYSIMYSRDKLKLNFKGRASIGSYNSHEEEMEE